jgi:hypothetical protein
MQSFVTRPWQRAMVNPSMSKISRRLHASDLIGVDVLSITFVRPMGRGPRHARGRAFHRGSTKRFCDVPLWRSDTASQPSIRLRSLPLHHCNLMSCATGALCCSEVTDVGRGYGN